MGEHPEWLDVGREVETVRRLGRSVAFRRRGHVLKHTQTQVTVQYPDGTVDRFKEKYGQYVEVPKYLDYTTTVEPTEEPA